MLTQAKAVSILFLACFPIDKYTPELLSIAFPVPVFILQAPLNEAVLETPYPAFQWQLSTLPADSSATYTLRVVEIFPGQTRETAIAQNSPYFSGSVGGGLFMYGLGLPPFLPGKAYAWQLTAFNDGTFVSAGDVWEFSLPADSIPLVPSAPYADTLYVEVNSGPSNVEYIGRGGIGVRLDPAYVMDAPGMLLLNAQMDSITIPPSAMTTTGNSLYFLDLSGVQAMIPGDRYRLILTDASYQKYEVKFIFVPW